jgi:hypothetical protein
LKCKICSKELIELNNHLYICRYVEKEAHSYTIRYGNRPIIESEEYRVFSKDSTNYCIWLDYLSKETHIIFRAQRKVLKDTLIDLNGLTENAIVDKISKLLVLF